jgi:hypothetical protein
MWGNRGIIKVACGTGALLLLALAAALVPLALQERATADFLAGLATIPGLGHPTDSAAYYAAFWSYLGVALVLVGVALGVAVTGDRSWFALTALLACLGGGLGIWALASARAEVRTTIPIGALAISAVALGALLLVVSSVGFVASPPMAARLPANPPVPPSHQAG